MIQDILTFATNTLHGLTADTVYTKFGGNQNNRSDFIGAGHTTVARNQLQLYRTFAKRNGEVLGSRKAAMKFTKDVLVDNASGTGQVRLPLILEVSMSIPEGTSENDVKALLACEWASNGLYSVLGSKLWIKLEI